MENQKTRRLAAIMFTDIVGYTALMQKDENAAADKRAHHREEFEQYHQKYHGEILQYFGDGTLSVFQSGVEAVECAIEIQKALKEGEPVPLRMGLHMGDIVFDGTDVYGDGVNLASRIESMGVAGAILLSGKLNDELKNHQHISTKSLGIFGLKNIENPVEIFSVTNEGIKTPARSELKGKQTALTKTIAVLPLVNMSADADNEYFSDGMTEEIINALAKIKGLKVTSRTSSFFFKNKKIPLSQIGEELNVATILEGSIRLSGNKMRITAQLINVKDDFHFWSETFDRSIDDIFAVQDEISLLIADRLREHLGHFELGSHLVDDLNIPIEVYKKYLKGRYYLMKLNVTGTEKAISIFQEVIAAQPNFALPYLTINQGYAFLGTMGLMPAQESFAKAKPFLEKALELNPNLPESQLNLAWIACWQNWDFKSTYEHLSKAIEIRPSDEIYLTMSNTLTVEGKLDTAQSYIDKALQLDPLSAINHHYKGFLFYLQEKYDEAIPYFKKSLQLKPELPFPHIYLGGIPLLEGRAEEGLTFFQNLPENGGGDLTKLGGTTMAYAALNNVPKTAEGIAKLEAALQSDSMGSAMKFLIMVKTIMGENDEVMQLIEQAIGYKLPLVLLINTEPILKPLHSVPRFQELMQQIFGKNNISDLAKKKYKKSSLKKAAAEKYYTVLEKYMAEEKPYLQGNLTLRQLAQLIDLHPNYLSELLNEKMGKNFSEYINHFRVETFQTLAQQPKNAHLSLLGLAYESGFNSKTAFNTFFKKETGMTPKQYLKSVV
jgi:adenylate cyclase